MGCPLQRPPGEGRRDIRSPLFFTILLCKPQSPRKDVTIRDPTKELGWEEERWVRGRKDHGKTQKEELWSLKPQWGQFRDLIAASAREGTQEVSRNSGVPSRRWDHKSFEIPYSSHLQNLFLGTPSLPLAMTVSAPERAGRLSATSPLWCTCGRKILDASASLRSYRLMNEG